MSETKFQCIICGYYTLDTRGLYDICPVCYWEDEGEIDDPSKPTYGPNDELSIKQARANYKLFGASSRERLENVRPPLPEETKASQG